MTSEEIANMHEKGADAFASHTVVKQRTPWAAHEHCTPEGVSPEYCICDQASALPVHGL